MAKEQKKQQKEYEKTNKAIIAAQSYGAMDVPKNQTVLKH
jgi:hypothetical protein